MNTPHATPASHLPAWLAGDTRPRWRQPRTWLLAGGVLALVAAALLWLRQGAAPPPPRYVTEPVSRGDLALTVTANGTLQPTRSVSIGSELSGTVARVLVDVNDRVRKGQLLVELDTAKLAAQLTKSDAALNNARAALAQAQATVTEARAALKRLQEVQRLSAGQLPAATELDAAQAALDRAVANEAAARASVTEAQATLTTDRTNLDKAAIRAPIDGVILTRAVEPGQAVAASLQAVTLFTLAEDLARMKLSVNVDEADVGQVQAGQRARFSVSAWPTRQYPATITRVAYGSTTTDNVVTYTTQLDVDNPDLTLRPGMTATAQIAATERKGVLLVPNTAFSYSPVSDTAAGGGGGGGGSGIVSALMPRPPGGNAPKKSATSGAGKAGGSRQVWVLKEGRPVALPVQAGLSNGRLTEVSGPGLAEGLPVITDQQSGAPR